MKQVLSKFYSYFLLFCLIVFKGRRPKLQKTLIVDIDNTIADTWPLLKEGLRGKQLYQSIPPKSSVLSFITDKYNHGFKIVFLSARNPKNYWVTKNWLLKYVSFRFELILVPFANCKFIFIRFFKSRSDLIEIIDDLSFNHENDNIRFYEEEIAKIRAEKIKYYDYNYIQNLDT